VTPSAPGRWLPWSLTGLAIAAQIAWPLTEGSGRTATTQVVVVLFAAASISHAWVHRGVRWCIGYTGISLAFGLGVEVLGISTGLPFSGYSYGPSLTPQLLDVPIVVPLAWAMMAYPALLIGRKLATSKPAQVAIGAFALSGWDLFLDPQMVGEGYWRWHNPDPALPGVPDVPIANYLGWFVAAAVLMTLLSWLPDVAADDRVPAVLYGWTWIGGIVANAVFLDRPAVAVWGGLVMGIVAVPYFRTVLSTRRSTPTRLTTPTDASGGLRTDATAEHPAGAAAEIPPANGGEQR
jgi:putative membrane protein